MQKDLLKLFSNLNQSESKDLSKVSLYIINSWYHVLRFYGFMGKFSSGNFGKVTLKNFCCQPECK